MAILVPVHALLLRRLADNTLLPGTVKKEEVAYYARWHAFMCKAEDEPVPSEAVLQRLGAVLGYQTQTHGVVLGYITLLLTVSQTLTSLMALQGSSLRVRTHFF